MLLRHVVSQFARQFAEQRVQVALAEAGSPEAKDVSNFDIAFLFALGIEAGGLIDCLRQTAAVRFPSFVHRLCLTPAGLRVAVVETGVGPAKAERATRELLAAHRPGWIISAGLAGALQPHVRRGQLLMPDELVDQSGERLSLGLSLSEDAVASSPGLHVGRLLTVDQLIRDPAIKRELGARHEALACDMETMAVAKVCQQEKVRFLSVRIISDAVDDRLPREIEQLVEQTSLAAKLGAAAGALVRRPSSAKDMWKLREDAMKASDKLAKFLLAILPQLTPDLSASREDLSASRETEVQ